MAGQPILIVEDDEETARLFGFELRGAGHDVQLAADAESALSFLERSTPAAAIVDLHLPNLDGLELVRRLRARPELARTPVAVITGDYMLDESVASELASLGAQIWFKPIWADDLSAIITRLVGRA